MWPALTNQISNLFRSIYKLSLHLRAEAPNKKLTCISRRDSAVSRIYEEMKWYEPEIRFIWLWYNLEGTLVIL